MAPKLVDFEEAVQMLGISKEKLNALRDSGKVHAYRDGASWKFKAEEIDRLKRDLAAEAEADDDEAGVLDEVSENHMDSMSDSILLSEVELGESNKGTSSTVIGKSGQAPDEDSDVKRAGEATKEDSDLAMKEEEEATVTSESRLTLGSDVKLAAGSSDILDSAGMPSGKATRDDTPGTAPGGSLFDDIEELELDLEAESSKIFTGEIPVREAKKPAPSAEDLALGESGLSLGEIKPDSGKAAAVKPGSSKTSSVAGGSQVGGAAGDSTLELEADEDDEMVLGEGSGSDITLSSEDSGIGLGAPSDSGLSLDQAPLHLGGSAVESLALGEDDDILLEEDADSEAATQLKADDDFLLTPLDEGAADEGEDSSSQVIALDSDSFDDSADTLLGGGEPAGGAALIDEFGEPEVGMTGERAAAPTLMVPATAAEVPYTAANLVSLILCVGMLSVTGVMLFDLIRNMWSWDQPYALNSSIMDALIDAIPLFKK